MPKSYSATSIRTLWENNPDTPMHSSNLSRLQDFTASYLNTDGYPDLSGYENLHVEGTILFADPNNASNLVLKRGTVIQIINEAVNLNDEPVIAKNEQYRIFDVGLEDIILTTSRTDDTHSDKSSWGTGINSWFVFFCDKDDNIVYKTDSEDYGGGAQILISKQSDFPRAQVPGRPTNNYSAGDTRLIGGFTTDNNNIVQSSIWDIAGKFNSVKARSYHILDEYNGVFRKINVSDLDTTSVESTFNNNVVINGSITSGNVTAADISGQNASFSGTLQTSQAATFSDNVAVSGTTDLTDVNISAPVNSTSDVIIDGGILSVIDGASNKFTVDSQTSEITIDSNITSVGSLDLTGDFGQVGNITQMGDVVLGDNREIGFETNIYTVTLGNIINMYGEITIDGNLMLPSSDGNTTLFEIEQETQTLNIDVVNTVIDSDVTLDGDLTLNGQLITNAGTSDISFNTTGSINSSVGPGNSWAHQGSFIVDGGDIDFVVRQNAANEIFKINTTTEQVTIDGDMDVIVPWNKTFNVEDHEGRTIFGFENSTAHPEHHVAVNASLDISQGSAENSLNVTGNSYMNGDLTVTGTLTANIDGNTSGSAASWSNPLELVFTGTDVTGTVQFDGSEESVDVTLQVADDSHLHDNSYYQKDQFLSSAGGNAAVIDYAIIQGTPSSLPPEPHDNTSHTEDYVTAAGVTYENLLNNGDIGETLDTVARGLHTHGQYFIKDSDNAAEIVYNNTIESTTFNNVDEALDGIISNFSSYVKTNSNATLADITANSLVASGQVQSGNLVSTSIDTGTIKVDNGQLNAGIEFDYSDSREAKIYTDGLDLKYRASDGSTPSIKRIALTESEGVDHVEESRALVQPQNLNFLEGGGIKAESGILTGQRIGDGINEVIPIYLELDDLYIQNVAMRAIEPEDNSIEEVWYKADGTTVNPQNSENQKFITGKKLRLNFLTSSGDNGTDERAARSDHVHDTRYYQKSETYTRSQLNSGQLDTRYYTEEEVESGVDQLIINMLNTFGAPAGTSVVNPFTGNFVNN